MSQPTHHTAPTADVIVVTGASSGFGNLAARALARAGHTVYAGMRATDGRNAARVAELAQLSADEGLDVRGIEMDVQDQASVDAAIARIAEEQGRLDVVVHNAGHMVLGPAEAFTPEQLAELYDINVLSTQRVNRAALPLMRRAGSGLLVWVASSSTRGGHPPFLAPYFAAKAGMDALAESYAAEVIRYGIDTVIIVPGAYPSGTNHFAHAGQPADPDRAAEYDAAYGELRDQMADRLTALFPAGRTVDEVADAIVEAVALPAGQRPFRIHIDPSRDGSDVVSTVSDRIRAEFYHRIGIADLLTDHASR
ncbi:short-chain dehydrogenase/reductase SDR [Catenulispora acidiphila DSM 44928]|uniref:Short-chain dehydrogenase/reductase SDR n=1 Tax=Catenulispora acidiphila (strain DSM 44928 / JCM 14897 / NBRC 102108 / NRRL B-24433 / ID139908) TaxID=479433 RepID=C7PZL0_CATAD|nr:SDR family oxidoreductase [Catenulispora acidiphila]ACU73525.1 short-chain dehydrogenase/reductase SDR [Catenulispora acidiphila DSM 44928]